MSYSKNKRYKLWLEDHHCYICNEITFLPEDIRTLYSIPQWHNISNYKNRVPKDMLYRMATIDHLYNRFESYRYSSNHNNEIRLKLACFKCNTTRGHDDYHRLSKEEKNLYKGVRIIFKLINNKEYIKKNGIVCKEVVRNAN